MSVQVECVGQLPTPCNRCLKTYMLGRYYCSIQGGHQQKTFVFDLVW